MNRDRPVERDAVISVDGIHFQYDSHPLFHDLSLTVRESEFLSVIGPNGSGKSTLLKLILGIMKPSKGRIAVFGKDIGKMKRKAISQLVSGVLLDFNPAYSFSVEEIVAIGRTPYAKAFSDFTREDRIAIEEALEKTSLLTLRKKPFEHLSSGERQRVLPSEMFGSENPDLAAGRMCRAFGSRARATIFRSRARQKPKGKDHRRHGLSRHQPGEPVL